MIRVASAQSDVVFGNPMANAEAAISKLEMLKEQGVQLVVFPEAYLTGYCVNCTEEAEGIAIRPLPLVPEAEGEGAGDGGSALQALRAASDRLDILVIAGYAESHNGRLYNAAVLLEPGEEPRYYRKTHLPELGLDKFVQPGEGPLKPFETRLGKIGVLICFDMRPPEATRALALQGADIIVLPTNWPDGAQVSAEHICIARAAENRVFFVTCNRAGEENGFRFIGRSKIIDPTGKVLAAAGEAEETIIADLNLDQARLKRTVTIPGKYETEIFKSRRPELYGDLVRKP